jgi:peptide/nickel transport system permease protein
MLPSFLRRLATLAATAVVASVAVFVLLSVVPGDPAQVALGLNTSPEALAAQRAAMGLDNSPVLRYLDWLGGIVRGDFGISSASKQPIGPELLDKLQVTLTLVLCALVIALIVAIPVGILAAVRQRRIDGVLVSAASQVGISIPGFLVGMLLVTVFAVRLGWLPSSGWVRPSDNFGEFLRHVTLPALALGAVQAAVLTRYVRSAVLEIMREDFLRTARSKGLRPLKALVVHGLRNAAVPVITVTGVQLATMLVGAVVIERVFVINGIGSMLLDRVANRDMVAVQGIVLVLVLLVLVINTVVDALYTLVDPRLRERVAG